MQITLWEWSAAGNSSVSFSAKCAVNNLIYKTGHVCACVCVRDSWWSCHVIRRILVYEYFTPWQNIFTVFKTLATCYVSALTYLLTYLLTDNGIRESAKSLILYYCNLLFERQVQELQRVAEKKRRVLRVKHTGTPRLDAGDLLKINSTTWTRVVLAWRLRDAVAPTPTSADRATVYSGARSVVAPTRPFTLHTTCHQHCTPNRSLYSYSYSYKI